MPLSFRFTLPFVLVLLCISQFFLLHTLIVCWFFFAISLIMKWYYKPQEFISVSSILDSRYYRWHLSMSLYNSKDLEIYNNFHFNWICHWILFACAEKLLFFVVFFALLIFVLCLFSFSEVTFPFMAISLFVWLSSYSYSMSG